MSIHIADHTGLATEKLQIPVPVPLFPRNDLFRRQYMSIRRIQQLILTVLACTLASLAPTTFGQDVSSKITGTVTDASGAVISGASVAATEKSRGTVYPAETNSAGVY